MRKGSNAPSGTTATSPRGPGTFTLTLTLNNGITLGQRLGKLVRVEIRPNRIDGFTGVEVEVDLTKA